MAEYVGDATVVKFGGSVSAVDSQKRVLSKKSIAVNRPLPDEARVSGKIKLLVGGRFLNRVQNLNFFFCVGGGAPPQRPLVPLLFGPTFFPIILFWSTTLLTRITGISLHIQRNLNFISYELSVYRVSPIT
jgi:hypothetical protein